MVSKNTILVRAPKDIMKILKTKLPSSTDANRIRFLYDTSALRLDNWLGEPFSKKKKK